MHAPGAGPAVLGHIVRPERPISTDPLAHAPGLSAAALPRPGQRRGLCQGERSADTPRLALVAEDGESPFGSLAMPGTSIAMPHPTPHRHARPRSGHPSAHGTVLSRPDDDRSGLHGDEPRGAAAHDDTGDRLRTIPMARLRNEPNSAQCLDPVSCSDTCRRGAGAEAASPIAMPGLVPGIQAPTARSRPDRGSVRRRERPPRRRTARDRRAWLHPASGQRIDFGASWEAPVPGGCESAGAALRRVSERRS